MTIGNNGHRKWHNILLETSFKEGSKATMISGLKTHIPWNCIVFSHHHLYAENGGDQNRDENRKTNI